jgi:hypothetical protein
VSDRRHDPQRWQKRFDDRELTRRILDRTSGRACGRAELLLGSRWDAEPERTDGELLAAHLDDCAACREMATILDRLQPLLPGLAEREPGPAFTARVLARTSAAQPVPGAAASGRLAGLLQRLGERARRAWDRPRFALEAAWTAAALLALLVWSPLAPGAAADQATQIVQAGATATPELLVRVDQLADSALLAGREIRGPYAGRIERQAAELRRELSRRFETVKQEGHELWERVAGDQPQSQSD